MHASSSLRMLQSVVGLPVAGFQIPANATIFSAIQPTGVFHLGNYLGAVRSWVDLARDAPHDTRIFYAVADLHAITVPKDPKLLRTWRQDALASILATRLDPDRCVVYHQSTVPEHSELSWMLSTMTGMGQLSRMVQWKSKANVSESSNINTMDDKSLNKLQLGLFAYPVLQAADILIHKATLVPVGDDQSQHLELTRSIAQTFNHRYGRPVSEVSEGVKAAPDVGNPSSIFPLPSTIFAPYKKIASLRNPIRKMSKSDMDQRATLYITDPPDVIRKKTRAAVTDSVQGPITFDPENRPGVSNLLLMASGLLKITPQELLQNYLSHVKNHMELKDSVSEIFIDQLADVRNHFTQLRNEPGYLESVSQKGTARAKESAVRTIEEVKRVMGF